MSSGHGVYGDVHNNVSVYSSIDAMLECYKILSRTRMEEEVRLKFLRKVLEVVGDFRLENNQLPSEGVDISHDQQSYAGNVHFSESERQHTDNKVNVEENEKVLLPFLRKAISHGDLDGKNAKLLLQCLQDSRLISTIDANNVLQLASLVIETDSNNQHEIEEAGVHAQKEKVLKKFEKHSTEDINRRFKTLDSDFKEASNPRCNVMSFSSGSQGSKGKSVPAGHATVHVEGTSPSCLADNTLAKKGSLFSGYQIEKGESCQLFQNNQKEANLSKISFLDAVKYGKENLKPHVPLVSGNQPAKHDEQLFSNVEDSSLYRIDPTVLERRMEMCNLSLVGKVTLVKGDAPWLLKKLKDRLEFIWNLKSSWRLISLGKGFFHILLNSKDDWDKVWSFGSISLKPGVLRLHRWSVDFDPTKERNTNAQVWLRIYNLPWCLWETSVLAGITRKVGMPIRIDKATLESDFGHFARVLVDIDLSKEFKSSVHVEYGSHVFEVMLVPENIPMFCRNCHAIGHPTKECRLIFKKGGQPLSSKHSCQFAGNDGSLFNPVEDCLPLVNKNKPVKKKFVNQVTEWKQKKAKTLDSVHDCVEGGKGNISQPLKLVETITDFGTQLVFNAPKDSISNDMFSQNKFSILYDLDEVESGFIRDGTLPIGDNHCPLQRIDDPVIEQSLEDELIMNIPEKSNISDSVVDDFIPPKLPARWEDILDEEEEIDKVPISRPLKSIAEIRENLSHLFMDRTAPEIDLVEPDPHVYPEEASLTIAPLSIKRDKKVKIGFRHTKGSSSSHKR